MLASNGSNTCFKNCRTLKHSLFKPFCDEMPDHYKKKWE